MISFLPSAFCRLTVFEWFSAGISRVYQATAGYLWEGSNKDTGYRKWLSYYAGGTAEQYPKSAKLHKNKLLSNQFTCRKKYPVWKAPRVSSNYRKSSGGYRECIKITDNWRSAGRGFFVQYFFLEWEKLNLQIKRRHTHEVCFSRI